MSLSREYESRAVQTTFSPPCSPCSVVSPLPLSLDGGPQSEISTSTVESSLETLDNPSQNSDGSLVSCLSTPDRSISTSRRIFKTRLPPNFPSRITHTITQRITSLPETAPSFSVKSQISSQQRVVTMPEDIRSQRLEKEFVLYLPEYEDSPIETSNSFSISDGNSSFARPGATGADVSHSSSSPSSPDSVVIIQNKHHISQAFLRQTSIQAKPKTDEDWMTWASSPPRPIPALHGPSSLPYARCPSGAEGTIIEEQDNLPRMIWGLDQDTTKLDITAPEFSRRTFESNSASGTVRNVSSVAPSPNPPVTINIENTKAATEQKTHHPDFIESIDLGPAMLTSHIQDHTYQLPQIDAAIATPTGVTDDSFQRKAYHERNSNRKQEVGVGLTPLPPRHETFKNAKPLVSTQTVVGSSLPIIILESQPQSISVPTKRRQSAMEIAQQYRKNQSLFQPAAQSQWSSNPSYSPALQAIHLPTLSAEASELSPPNQTRTYNHPANDVYLPPAAIDPQAISPYGLHHTAGLSRTQRVLASPGSDLHSYPRPPPNTPMNALAKSRIANVPLRMNHLPASPDSPSTAIRSLQHTKVAPMTRFSHRRLSAVLEASEDQNAGVGFRPLSPPPFQQNFHLSRPLIPDGTAHPLSYANLAKDLQNYHYQLENVSKASAALLSEDFSKLTIEPFTPDWIQSQAQPGGSLMNGRHGVTKVDLQPPQRGHKTNKTASSGKVRGPGQRNQPQGQAPGRKNRSKKKVANGMMVIAA